MAANSQKKLVRVMLRYDDGSTMYVAGEMDCAAWASMVLAQAGMAAAHGLTFPTGAIAWKTTPPSPKVAALTNIVHMQITDPGAPICRECGNRATLHVFMGRESYQCNECGAAVDSIGEAFESAMPVATFEQRIIKLSRGEYSPDEAGHVALELLAEYRRLLGVIGTEREEGR